MKWGVYRGKRKHCNSRKWYTTFKFMTTVFTYKKYLISVCLDIVIACFSISMTTSATEPSIFGSLFEWVSSWTWSINLRAFLTPVRCVKCVRIRSFSGPYFSPFGLNMDRYGINLRIQSKCGKIRTKKFWIRTILTQWLLTNQNLFRIMTITFYYVLLH